MPQTGGRIGETSNAGGVSIYPDHRTRQGRWFRVGTFATHLACRLEVETFDLRNVATGGRIAFGHHSSSSVQPGDRGYGIEAVAWFEYALSTLLESTAVVT